MTLLSLSRWLSKPLIGCDKLISDEPFLHPALLRFTPVSFITLTVLLIKTVVRCIYFPDSFLLKPVRPPNSVCMLHAPHENPRRAGEADSKYDVTGSSGKAEGFLPALLAAFNSDSSFSFSSRDGDVQTYYSSSAVAVASVSSVGASAGGGGVCECCGASLKVLGLGPEDRTRVRSALKKLAAEETAYTVSPPPPPLPLPQVPPKRRQSSRLDSARPGEGQQGGNTEQAGRGLLGGAMGDLEQFAAWLEERRREVSQSPMILWGMGLRVSICC